MDKIMKDLIYYVESFIGFLLLIIIVTIVSALFGNTIYTLIGGGLILFGALVSIVTHEPKFD